MKSCDFIVLNLNLTTVKLLTTASPYHDSKRGENMQTPHMTYIWVLTQGQR